MINSQSEATNKVEKIVMTFEVKLPLLMLHICLKLCMF